MHDSRFDEFCIMSYTGFGCFVRRRALKAQMRIYEGIHFSASAGNTHVRDAVCILPARFKENAGDTREIKV